MRGNYPSVTTRCNPFETSTYMASTDPITDTRVVLDINWSLQSNVRVFEHTIIDSVIGCPCCGDHENLRRINGHSSPDFYCTRCLAICELKVSNGRTLVYTHQRHFFGPQPAIAITRTAPTGLFRLAALLVARARPWSEQEWATDRQFGGLRYALSNLRGSLTIAFDRGGAWFRHMSSEALRWMLRSQVRTWMPLSSVLVWGVADIARDDGAGAAILAGLLGIGGLLGLVHVLRKSLGVTVKKPDPGVDE